MVELTEVALAPRLTRRVSAAHLITLAELACGAITAMWAVLLNPVNVSAISRRPT
ncbi:MAG: hypothetical protein OXS47_04330 [Chloroflexota bacterium]|nr:hypothetical protein [Chloroflexota bacterium]